MFSKCLISILLLMTVTLASCNLPLYENAANLPNDNLKLGEDTQCLSNVLPVMSGFMDGTAKPEEVSKVWECFGNAMATYLKYVRGEKRDQYAARELAIFFETYFLDKTKINDRLLQEVMHLKQMLVGGSSSSLTRDELRALIDLSNQMKRISLKILPYMKVYAQSWKTSASASSVDEDIRFFDNANLAIQEAANELAAIIERNHQSYVLQNFVVLLDEMSKLYGEKWDFIETLDRVMPLVEKLKVTLMGGDEKSISSYEWRRFALLGARGYVQYLRYYYFIDQAQQTGKPQLAYIARSFDDLFDYLREMVDAKPGRALTKAELLDVLQQLNRILPEVNISKEFVDEFMKIKLVFFGGSTEKWTPEEFKLAQQRVTDFRNLIEKILTYADYYTFNWDKNILTEAEAQQLAKEAENNLNEFGTRLGEIMGASYDLNDLAKFMEEIEKAFATSKSESELPAQIKKYIALIVAYKNIVLSDSGGVVPADKWSYLLGNTARLYSVGAYFYYFVKPRSIFSDGGLASVSLFFKQTLEFLNSLIKDKPGKVITFAELDQLIDAAIKSEMLPPDKVDAKILQNLVRVVLNRILVPWTDRLKNIKPNGISAVTTEVLRKEFNIWLDSQRFMEVVFQSAPVGIAGLSPQSIIEALERSTKTEGQKELINIFKTKIPLTLDGAERLFLSYRQIDYSFSSVSWINISRAIVRLVNSSYISEPKRIENNVGFNKDEANQLYADVKPFFVRWGLIDETNVTFADSRFFEANLFVPRANGNKAVEFTEGVDLFMMILSGLELDSMFRERYEDPTAGCVPVSRSPRMRENRVNVDCFVRIYRRDFSQVFASLPNYDRFQSTMSDKDFSEMMINILLGAGWVEDPKRPGVVSYGDLSLVPHVVQYIESLLQRYDANQNGLIEMEEAKVAYPILAEFLRDNGGFRDETWNTAVLMWLLAYGKPPDGFSEKLKFFFWAGDEAAWKKNVKADRKKLSSIIGFIANSISAQGKAAALKQQYTAPSWLAPGSELPTQ